ncbi:MAG: enoyl-CoA hydratase/isomerase family protein [Flavobacteriaceae bacterium]|nr:enoyl-CoA hydratase/isomerase family protein [Bacteroidia bacterium]NNK87254.1 enoyl-CoA hydratase/isomerase family protein [Flavobacteriaceae bacterium]
MDKAYVKHHIEDGVGWIEFFHPAHNSLPADILAELATTITHFGKKKDVKVIVLKSGGDRTFCAGASFNELVAIENEEMGKAFFLGFANVINAMRKCPKLIIGRLQGKAVGGGVGLAAATDYCMATRFAQIKLSELHVGIGPFVVGPAVERKLGISGMSQIAIDANAFYTAEWAQQKGLYAKIFDSTEELDEAVKTFVKQLCHYNVEAMKELKAMFWSGTEHWDELLSERAAISGRLVLSEFTKQTLKRFKT